MVSRERILEAAARVYAKHGFKGATTRLIAIEAGVNEVTLFRTFGSKSALLEAVLIQHVERDQPSSLPATPVDPRAELRAFIDAKMRKMEEIRPLLLHTMSEIEDRPEAQEFACRGREQVHVIITTYIRQLQQMGLADPDVDADIAALMLTGTIIADVMGRAIIPHLYPPLEEVADRYTTLFLRAIGGGTQVVAPEQTPIPETAARKRAVGSSSRPSNTSSDSHR